MSTASTVLGGYKVGERIASGGFGIVFRGEGSDGEEVAIKQERTYNTITRPYLQHEADVYRHLTGGTCVPAVKVYGREGRWNIMILDLLGPSLQSLFESCGRRFSLKTTLMLAFQILTCIEYVHNHNFIHRDIKPGNFLMGASQLDHNLRVIDFGLARRFRHPDTKAHFPYSEGHDFFGTMGFASLNTQLGRSQSRRDDLESASLMLIYFLRGKLPWQDVHGGTEKYREKCILEKKRTWNPARLCEGLPKEFLTLLEYSRSLHFEQQPDYGYARGIFQDLFERQGYQFDSQYDWALPEVKHVGASVRVSNRLLFTCTSINGSGAPSSDTCGLDPIRPVATPSVLVGDYVLVKLLARENLEYDMRSFAKSQDPSRWHNPSLSRDEWYFPWRPAVILKVISKEKSTTITVLPLVRRSEGLEGVSSTRKSQFIHVRGPLDSGDCDIVIQPHWPWDRTYHYHTRDLFRVSVTHDKVRSFAAHWHLDEEQVSKLDLSRASALPSLEDTRIHESDGEETRSVKRNYKNHTATVDYPVFADIAPLTIDAFSDPGVDFQGLSGWLPEFNKIDMRRREEDNDISGSNDSDDSDDENLSMYTGPSPSNRRLSCTLAIVTDADSEAQGHQ